MVLITYHTAKGQVDVPANPDYNGSLVAVPVASIAHTGNDVKTVQGRNWSVMCWDGTSPSWSWAINNSVRQTEPIQGNTLGTVSDPDIVISHDGTLVEIVYVVNGTQVYHETWKYNGTLYSFAYSALLASEGENPNIDINSDDLLAVTYQGLGAPQVFAYVGVSGSTPLSGPTLVAEGYRPDVCISNVGANSLTSDVWVSFTYLDANQNFRFHLDQHLYVDLIAGNGSAGLGTFIDVHKKYPLVNSGILGYPRIAANYFDYDSPLPPCIATVRDINRACAVVVDYILDQREFILAYTRVVSTCAAPLFTDVAVIVNNDASASSAQYDNRGPVVCYSGDFIQVAWEFTDNPTFPLGNTSGRDILLRRLTWGGVLTGLNIYSRVNFSTVLTFPNFNQTIPSIAGRYAVNGTGTSVCHFMFVDDDPAVQQIRYKIGVWSDVNLRPVKNESQTNYQKSIHSIEKIDFYPNPSKGELYCSGCSEGSLVVVYDATGRESMKQQVLNAQAPLRLDELANGLYRIQVVQVNGDIYRTNLIKE